MKRLFVFVLILMMMVGCGNKKRAFDYSTLPGGWLELSDDGLSICNDKTSLTMDGNTIIRWFPNEGEKWTLEILSAYRTDSVVRFNVKQGVWAMAVSFCWVDKDEGIGKWVFGAGDSALFVSDKKADGYPRFNCLEPEKSSKEDDDDDVQYLTDAKLESENPDELVPSNERIFFKTFGDLDGNGGEDCIIITKQTRKDLVETDDFHEATDRNRLGIVIALKYGDVYRTACASSGCFASDNVGGGTYLPPELSVSVKRGNLVIHYAHGRNGWLQYTFRYGEKRFHLIGYDEEYDRGPVLESRTSINFLTRKKQTLTNVNADSQDGDAVIEEKWQDIAIIDDLAKLDEIRKFDDLNLSDYYYDKE